MKERKRTYTEEEVNELKKWFKQLPNDNPSKRHKHYSMIDENGVFFPDNIFNILRTYNNYYKPKIRNKQNIFLDNKNIQN